MTITTWTAQNDEMTPDDVPVIMVEEAHMVGQEEVTVGMVVAGAMAVVTDGMTIIMTGVAEAVVSNVVRKDSAAAPLVVHADGGSAAGDRPAIADPSNDGCNDSTAATATIAGTVVEQRPKRKKLEVEDFAGTAGENVVSWLEAVKQAQQMQMVLYGEDWTSGDLYYGNSAHRKGAAATWFRKLDAQTPPEMKNAAYLEWHLRDTYGSKESAWEV
ncbi:hypothetical protein PInf_010481 [Phytophthora infestans]|nr:hypothetical protein PInf_010481 [Phytophthora infestans]